MKLVFLLLIASLGFSQDIMQTEATSYKVTVVAIDSSTIAFVEEGKMTIGLSLHKAFKSVVLESGETIVKNNKLLVGDDHSLWNTETRTLSGKVPAIHSVNSNGTNLVVPSQNNQFVNDQPNSGLSLRQISGVLIALSGGLGLYLANDEYDGDVFNIDQETGIYKGYSDEFLNWNDNQKMLTNIQYLSLGVGGIIITLSVEF